MLTLADVLGALEHHVLEQVGESGSSLPLVAGSHVVVHGDREDRRGMVFGDDDTQPVGERGVRELGWRGTNRGDGDGRDDSERGRDAEAAVGQNHEKASMGGRSASVKRWTRLVARQFAEGARNVHASFHIVTQWGPARQRLASDAEGAHVGPARPSATTRGRAATMSHL